MHGNERRNALLGDDSIDGARSLRVEANRQVKNLAPTAQVKRALALKHRRSWLVAPPQFSSAPTPKRANRFFESAQNRHVNASRVPVGHRGKHWIGALRAEHDRMPRQHRHAAAARLITSLRAPAAGPSVHCCGLSAVVHQIHILQTAIPCEGVVRNAPVCCRAPASCAEMGRGPLTGGVQTAVTV